MPSYPEHVQREIDRQRAYQRSFDNDPLWLISGGGNKRRRNRPNNSQLRKMRLLVFARDAFTCQACGVQFPAEPEYTGQYAPYILGVGHLALDHIIPYAHGGQFTPENLRACCEPCNMRRGAKPLTTAVADE